MHYDCLSTWEGICTNLQMEQRQKKHSNRSRPRSVIELQVLGIKSRHESVGMVSDHFPVYSVGSTNIPSFHLRDVGRPTEIGSLNEEPWN